MPIFYSPDVTKYPDNFLTQAIKCPGLEQLTGADFAICKLPIPPTKNLSVQIKNKALFVQVKVGYDICSVDNLHSSIARMQTCKIPKGQAILLPIGEYWQDENGLLRLKGQKAFGHMQYSSLGTIYDMWSMRGGIVEPMPPKSIDNLMPWIERKQKSIDKIGREGKRDIYPQSPVFEPDDIWQAVEEINDWRTFIVSGLKNCGSKTVNSIWNYAQEHRPNSYLDFFEVLCLMTDEKDGKAIHKIPLWGDKSRQDFRNKLGIYDNWNLGQLLYRIAFYTGWKSFGNDFITAIKKRKKLSPQIINEILEKLMKEADKDIDENGCIPF